MQEFRTNGSPEIIIDTTEREDLESGKTYEYYVVRIQVAGFERLDRLLACFVFPGITQKYRQLRNVCTHAHPTYHAKCSATLFKASYVKHLVEWIVGEVRSYIRDMQQQ